MSLDVTHYVEHVYNRDDYNLCLENLIDGDNQGFLGAFKGRKKGLDDSCNDSRIDPTERANFHI